MTHPLIDGVPRDCRPALKLIMVGNNKVGKTCLVSAYLKRPADMNPAPTVAPAFSSRHVKKRDGSPVLLEIWDTAGQEK
jgi:small GTP-binding protein